MTSKETARNRSAALRSGAELELGFTDLLANGQAVGRADGVVVFCFGPLPDERARVRITDVKQKYAVAELIELRSESPARAAPFCPVFGACGGCQLQHLEYRGQLRWKRDVVREALARIGGFAGIEVAETIGMAEPRAYRNKMALVVDHRRSPAGFGFYRQRSHDVVPVAACPIVTPALNADLARLEALRDIAPVRAVLEDARHIVVRSARASDASVVTVTTAARSERVRHAAPTLMREMPRVAGVTNSFDLASANVILGRHQEVVAGTGEVEEALGGVRFRVSTDSFFQVNVEMLERILSYLEGRLVMPCRVVDLYCGVGTFALFFAAHGCTVHGVEENPRAVAQAAENARANALDRLAKFFPGRAERLLGAPPLREAMREAAAVFLDPPRKGCDEVTLGAVADARVPAIWYLSCDPATLARDLKFLVAKGYRLDTVQPFDMFPQTGHVEALVHLEYS